MRVIEQLAECEISAQAGIAATPDTSFLAAHLARPVLHIENAKEFLAPLPIETLGTHFPGFLIETLRVRSSAPRARPLISGSSLVSRLFQFALQRTISRGHTPSERHWRNRVARTQTAQRNKKLER